MPHAHRLKFSFTLISKIKVKQKCQNFTHSLLNRITGFEYPKSISPIFFCAIHNVKAIYKHDTPNLTQISKMFSTTFLSLDNHQNKMSSPSCSIFQFLWHESTHHGPFQGTKVSYWTQSWKERHSDTRCILFSADRYDKH